MTQLRFNVKDPEEAVPLEFDFSPDLVDGVLLTGIVSVEVTTTYGTDPNPTAILNGTPLLDPTFTQAIVPVINGLDGCDYTVVVQCTTTNPLLILAMPVALPVRRL